MGLRSLRLTGEASAESPGARAEEVDALRLNRLFANGRTVNETRPARSRAMWVIVVSVYPMSTFGCERMTSRSKYGSKRIESPPPMVDMMPSIVGTANAAIKSPARASG